MKGEGRSVDVANRHPRLRIDRRRVAAAIALLDANAGKFRGGCPPGVLSVAFLQDPALAGLHARYLGDPSATDVITFAGDPANWFKNASWAAGIGFWKIAGSYVANGASGT